MNATRTADEIREDVFQFLRPRHREGRPVVGMLRRLGSSSYGPAGIAATAAESTDHSYGEDLVGVPAAAAESSFGYGNPLASPASRAARPCSTWARAPASTC